MQAFTLEAVCDAGEQCMLGAHARPWGSCSTTPASRAASVVVQAKGRSYHPSCFRCLTCGRALEGVPFTVGHDNQPYCLTDFHRLFAVRCAACQKPICPLQGSKESTRIVFSDRSYHVECCDRQANQT
ncbi:hypothetical protein CRUP_006305 [Coryphaenoides rupestris]|nr:hypothetical protein CRUP_006305 [Coryphaenoides rupestris]